MDELEKAMAAQYTRFQEAWADRPGLTPRQAFGIAAALDWFADAEIGPWLEDPSAEPLHTIPPFDVIDLRAMVLVNENRAWAALAAQRCSVVAEDLAAGYLSFFEEDDVCYFDQLVVVRAVRWAQNQMEDQPDFFEGIPPRLSGPEGDDGWQLDDSAGWASLSEMLDGYAARGDWNEVLFPGLRPMRDLLRKKNHPFTWFD
jgi:hypothetical protein